MEDVLRQAGFQTRSLAIRDIGFDRAASKFGDLENQEILNIFKLYPWEWMLREDGSEGLLSSRVLWVEPAWKMLLSNKAILKVLWDLFPEHKYLLRTTYVEQMGDYVKKPKMGREGRGVSVFRNGISFDPNPSPYDRDGFVYQEFFAIPEYEGVRPVIGSWIIGHEEGNCSAGMGVRETRGLITNNAGRFVPHYFVPRS